MAKALYICYFGLRQPLVQTQVLPYLRELLKSGYEITLLTFEPDLKDEWSTTQIVAEHKSMGETGIEWHCLPYHKRPSALATVYDIFRGAWHIRSVIREKKIDILHGRVHVPTLMGAIARRFSRRKPKLLFDIRGFFPEEYTDAGIWPEGGMLYRSVKRIEKWLMKEADGFVVLTEKAREILFLGSVTSGMDKKGRPVEVIPCCVDFEKRFLVDRDELRKRFRKRLGADKRRIFVHAGALGGLYLTEQIADFLQTARKRDPSTFALFLTQSDPKVIIPLLHKRGFADIDYFVARVSPAEIPGFLCAADAGLSFVKAGYATQSRSPTKIPEYLACGLPVIANRGVGDVDSLIEENGIGVLIDQCSTRDYEDALSKLAALDLQGDAFAKKCREVAERKFDLVDIGGARYGGIYGRLSPPR